MLCRRNKPELWFLVCVLSLRSFIHWQLVVTTPSLSVVIPLAHRHLHAVLLMTGHHLHSLPPLCHKPHFLRETLRKDQEHFSTFSQLPSRSKLARVVPWSRVVSLFSILLISVCWSSPGEMQVRPGSDRVTLYHDSAHSIINNCDTLWSTLPHTSPLATECMTVEQSGEGGSSVLNKNTVHPPHLNSTNLGPNELWTRSFQTYL